MNQYFEIDRGLIFTHNFWFCLNNLQKLYLQSQLLDFSQLFQIDEKKVN